MIACFIGHGTITDAEQVKIRLTETVTKLIKDGIDTFLFGSRSEFNDICWCVVTELQEKFPNIKRIKFNAPHEVAFTSKAERENCEMLFLHFAHKETHYTDYEEAFDSEKSSRAGKTAYIMRNEEMIDRSDVCVFYYNKDYLPPKRKPTNKYQPERQTKSGTAIACAYATQKKKRIINIFI